jgi:branched-subunit amino acid transport protein AzlD
MTTVQTTAPNQVPTKRAPMSSLRKTALVSGVLYLLTFVSIPTLALYGPVKDPNYILGPGPDTPALFGGILEIIVALTCIGTAVALYPVVKRQNEGVALGFVGARVLEAGTIFICVVSLLSVVSLRQAGVGAEGLVTAQALVAFHDWIFLLGQGFIPAVNALLLGYLLYKSRLVPRILPVLGFIGAPLLAASFTATLFDVWGQVSALSLFLTIPIALWEFSLGVYLIVKGFKPSPITAGMVEAETRRRSYQDAAV